MSNLLLEKIEYRVDKTRRGVWRRYLYPNGQSFTEYRSNRTWFGLPLLHYTSGICPETGRRVMVRGIVAVGRSACGGLAVGQVAFGLIAVGQLAVGGLFGLGQAASGLPAIGQLAVGAVFALGQISCGYTAIGQFALGYYVLAQLGIGEFVWSQQTAAPEAVDHFMHLARWLTTGARSE
jgi:hypothetical protein